MGVYDQTSLPYLLPIPARYLSTCTTTSQIPACEVPPPPPPPPTLSAFSSKSGQARPPNGLPAWLSTDTIPKQLKPDAPPPPHQPPSSTVASGTPAGRRLAILSSSRREAPRSSLSLEATGKAQTPEP